MRKRATTVLALVAMMSVGSAGAAQAEYLRDLDGGGGGYAYHARGNVEAIWCGTLQHSWYSIFC